MMNFAENHRTQSEYDNSRVGKNFLFQFVNNYFVNTQAIPTTASSPGLV